jgi:hypothetical protein
MAVTDEQRISILGVSVDETPDSPPLTADRWRATGSVGTQNKLRTEERIITRAINALATESDGLDLQVKGFDARVTRVVGDDATVDQAAFDSIGANLIHAVAGWSHEFTTASDSWVCTHDLHSKYVEVRAVKSDGTVMIPDIDYAGATDDEITLHFVDDVAGTVTIRR